MAMRYPSLFVNHGGGPLPLLGRDPATVRHMKEAVSKWLPKERPKSIVVVSAHWESNPIKITSAPKPSMYFDYYGFPPESYEYSYPAPGNPDLANKIQSLLQDKGLPSELDAQRGFDHGVFIPLMMMYPEADIPVVCVSLHASLSAQVNWELGTALSPLRDEGILILGSGFTFHNMDAFFHPSPETKKASTDFNEWLKDSMLNASLDHTERRQKLLKWDTAPGARLCHPREEHLLPLFVTAAAGGPMSKPTLIYDVSASTSDHAISSYMFE